MKGWKPNVKPETTAFQHMTTPEAVTRAPTNRLKMFPRTLTQPTMTLGVFFIAGDVD